MASQWAGVIDRDGGTAYLAEHVTPQQAVVLAYRALLELSLCDL